MTTFVLSVRDHLERAGFDTDGSNIVIYRISNRRDESRRCFVLNMQGLSEEAYDRVAIILAGQRLKSKCCRQGFACVKEF